MLKRFRLLLFLFTVLGPLLCAQTGDLRIGTWKLNVAKSTFRSGPPPQSIIDKFEATPEGFEGRALRSSC